jgi:endonuclease/exonuclease/phosphatase family metal-dependent hydrolase
MSLDRSKSNNKMVLLGDLNNNNQKKEKYRNNSNHKTQNKNNNSNLLNKIKFLLYLLNH